MKLYKILTIFTLVIASAIESIACSNGKSPVEPATDETSAISSDLPISIGTDIENRNLLAVYDAVIDPSAKTFTITPDSRSAQYHFALTQMYPSVLKITGYGFTPNLWADIKLVHPYPGSGIKAYDPRVIAILPANPGVRFSYPTLDSVGNNSVVLQPDGYTKLFDSLGGSIPGNVNPFKAYFKDQPYRVWSGTGVTEETQRWQMNIAGFGGAMQFKLVVDVSTNYPAIPEPVIDSAREPVQIDALIGTGLTPFGGSADITVTLLDWQGQSGIGGVKVEAPDLFDGTVSLSYQGPGPNPNEYEYTNVLINAFLAPEGEYNILIAAYDHSTGIYMYNQSSVFINNAADDGNLIWVKNAGGVSYDSGNGITTLSDNSLVLAGVFYEDATFGLDEPNQTVLVSAGEGDIFIARYYPDGTLLWAKSAGGSDNDYANGIATFSDNSIVVTGSFFGMATFGLGEANQTVLTSTGIDDIFIARYNSDGTLLWAKRAGGSGHDWGHGITTLSDNSTVVTGGFNNSATFGLGETNPTVVTSAGRADIFIAQYNTDGTHAWVKRAGGLDDDEGLGITALLDNSTVVTGYYHGTATFGQGEPNETVLTSSWEDIFTARYNPNGMLSWVKCGGATVDGRGYGVTTLSDNSTVVTGFFYGTAVFGQGEDNQTILVSAGSTDIFIAHYNPNGTLSWANCAGGLDVDHGYGITVLSDNSIVITGDFRGSATFGEGEPNEIVLVSVEGNDIFIARYNPDGELSWAKCAGGMTDFDRGCGITMLSDKSVVVTGFYTGSATFGPGEPNQTVLSATGDQDIFIARFKP